MKATFLYGTTGSGKTIRAVMLAVKDFIFGRQIYGNLHFKLIPYTYIEIPDLIDMVLHKNIDNNPKTLVLDEIQTAFDGRRSSSKQNINLSLFVSQCRKRGFNIIYTSQYITGADPRMRVLTDKLVQCIPSFNLNNVGYGDLESPEPTKITYLSTNPQFPTKINKKTVRRETLRHFYKFYDTFEIIRPEMSYAIGGD